MPTRPHSPKPSGTGAPALPEAPDADARHHPAPAPADVTQSSA
ncbi:hypothetical protein [Streptomyces sp. RK9]